jgi:hypothetical protein
VVEGSLDRTNRNHIRAKSRRNQLGFWKMQFAWQ